MFQLTTATSKILSLSKRKKVIQGGTWAGKSYNIIAVCLDWCTKNPKKKLTVTAETIPALKGGVLSQFKEIMMDTNKWFPERFNGTDLCYTFSNGTMMEFKSFENVGKAKAAGKRDALFINEANYIPYEIADALIMRTEGHIWIDYNPDNRFWVHDEIMPQKDAEFLLLRYTDNEALPETILEELQSKLEKAKTSEYWKNWCRVYIDGEIGNLQGVVFDNWQQCDLFPEDAQKITYGIDFGYTNDPTAIVKVGLYNGELYVEELLYKTRMNNLEIANFLKPLPKKDIFADSAEPKSIDEIYREGFNIKPVEKGKDSIINGIDVLHRYKINITINSINLIKEMRNYCWAKDRENRTLNKPEEGQQDHAIDAMRYVAMMRFNNKIVKSFLDDL